MKLIDDLFARRGAQFVTNTVDSANHAFAGQTTGDFLAQVLDVGIDGPFVTFKIISLLEGGLRNSRPRILERQDQVAGLEFGEDFQHAGSVDIPQSVLQYVGEELLQPVGIGHDRNQL